jgi:GNAT superfamily N-acetyltransferase
LFRILLRHFATHSTVLTAGSAAAVAIWSPPEPQQVDGIARLCFTLRLGALLGRRIPRGARVGTALESLHPKEPHWYLAILGTAPEAQARGLASSLLAPVLKRCDAAGLPAHLETATEANLAFYAARGFEVIGETVVVGGGPRIWGLRRAPGRHAQRSAQLRSSSCG